MPAATCSAGASPTRSATTSTRAVYAVAEVTNNYFSQISQISEGVRFSYDAVYDKVTSGTVGASFRRVHPAGHVLAAPPGLRHRL